MKYSCKIKAYDVEHNILKIELDEKLNIDRIRTMYNNDFSNVWGYLKIDDPRHFSFKQRRLFFALLNDISKKTGYRTETLKKMYETRFCEFYGSNISLKDNSNATVSDVNQLLDFVIDDALELNVSINPTTFKLLPRNESNFLYKLIVKRKCFVCMQDHSDIHHATNLVGMGRNRNKHNHLKSEYLCLCRKHHNEVHNLGLDSFLNKYKLITIKLDKMALKRLNMDNTNSFLED